MPIRFGKGSEAAFFDFVTGKMLQHGRSSGLPLFRIVMPLYLLD
jgi:hypothetical protein